MGRIDGRLIRRGALILLFLGGGLLFAACATPPGQPSRGPTAAFDASPTSGNSPLPVTFTDKSTGTITGWQWDFGDTATSTAQSPTHTYDAGGTYTVALTVTGPGGMNTPSTNTTSKTITVNAPPVVTITAPPDGTPSAPDLPMTFTGSATDREDGNLAAGIKWSSSIDGALGSGASLHTSGLTSGTHKITAAVTDSAGATGTATINIVVNAPPGIGITSPETGATFSPGDAIPFTGSATDLEDGVLSSSIQWSSSKDGPLGTGGSITSSLTSGAHTITASVTDTGGKTSTKSVSITVNAAPALSVTAPANGALYQLGNTVPLTGTASDAEDGDLSAGIQWSSSQDGPLGTGASLEASSLSAGTHTITASITDGGGKTTTASVSMAVNAPPAVSITAPANDALYQSGDPVTLTGTASDSEDGDLSAAIQWSSSQDGALGTGASINASSLSAGSHVITASVTDTGGKTVTSSITVIVNAAPAVTITSPQPGTTVQLDDAVNFTAVATDVEDGNLASSVQWKSDNELIGTGGTINVSTLAAGPHLVTASVTDGNGKTTTASVSITVNAPPVVSITGPASGALYQSGGPATFTGTASDTEDGDLSAAIQWSSSKDGTLGTGASINTSSLSAGSHVITASVTDGNGKTVSTSITVTVNAAPVVTITSPPNGTQVGVGDALNLTGTATDLEDGNLASSVQWKSDNELIGTGGTINVSSLPVGSHMITASVTDSQGGTDSKSIAVTVTAPVPPQANFSFSPTTGTAPLLVSYTDSSTGDITSWVWTFTSGTGGSSGPNVTHTFPTPGSYTATLTVSGPGGSSSSSKAIVVTSALPQASFTATPSIGIAPLTVSFTDHSTGSITSWTWSFSDGGSAIGQNVNHTFTTPGTYTATLSVNGPDGTSQFQRTIVVSSLPSGNPGGGREPVDPGGGRDGPPAQRVA